MTANRNDNTIRATDEQKQNFVSYIGERTDRTFRFQHGTDRVRKEMVQHWVASQSAANSYAQALDEQYAQMRSDLLEAAAQAYPRPKTAAEAARERLAELMGFKPKTKE